MQLEESKIIWNRNAEFWDNAMGDESNEFHREVVRPKVTELLKPQSTDYILDVACGNGNYSVYLAQKGVSVVAFDYSEKMIELAKKRQSQYASKIEFCVADATNFVFATQHPCFVTLTEKYMTSHSYYGIAIEGQPNEQIYYHRSIQDIFNLCFKTGFVIDGFYEECYKSNKEIPMIMVVRAKK